MKKSNLFRTTIPVIAFIFLLILTFSCQQQVEEGITDEEVQALVEKDMEIFNEGNLSMIDEIIAPNYKQHISDDPEDVVGIDAFKEYVTNLRTDFPDFNVSVEETIVKDDRIVWCWVSTGTNTGTSTELPPTGKKIRVEGVGILRVVDGKIVERVMYFNYATILTQLGFTITPPALEGEEESTEGEEE